MFKMPELSLRDVNRLTNDALDHACRSLKGVHENPGDKEWAAAAQQSSAAYCAWVNYSRQAFPDQQSAFMLDYERHWGPRTPFDYGDDRWAFSVEEDSWVIVKPDGRRIVTRKPRTQ